jgi:TRAP-type C4-dicarboxylate transport system permease small subunit
MKSGILAKIELIVGLVMLAVIVILVFMASIMRFFGHPLIWSVDFAQLLFIWLCFIGANRALRTKSHLGVDFFIRRFSLRRRFLLECAISLFILIFRASLIVKGVELTLLNKERLFGDSGIPYALVTIAVPFGCVLMSITIIGNIIKAFKSNVSERELILTKSEVLIEGKQ